MLKIERAMPSCLNTGRLVPPFPLVSTALIMNRPPTYIFEVDAWL